MTFEFSYQTIQLTELATVRALRVPPHHRCYSWGAAADPQEQSSQAFFKRFMFDRLAPPWMGAITLRATQRCSLPRSASSAPVELYIDDGNHRLANLVLTARATHELVQEALTEQVRCSMSERDVMRLERLTATPHLSAIAGINVECRLSGDQSASSVHHLVNSVHAAALEAKAGLAATTAALWSTRLQYGVDSDEYKSLLEAQRAWEVMLGNAEANLVYNTYLQLRSRLMGSSWSDFINTAEDVVERLQVINFALIMCQPVACSQPDGESSRGAAEAANQAV